MTTDRIQVYQEGIKRLEEKLEGQNRKYNLFAYGRAVVFILGIAACYFLFRYDYALGIFGGFAVLTAFLYLIKIHAELAEEREHLNRLISIRQTEIEALNGNRDSLDEGEEYINAEHSYSYDLDIFGRGSIFQAINRTGTIIGRGRLVQELEEPAQDAALIRQRQQAIAELAEKSEWGLNFQALGVGKLESKDETQSILRWLNEEAYFSKHPVYPALMWVLPGIFLLAFLLWLLPDIPLLAPIFGDFRLPGLIPLLLFFAQLGVIGQNLKRTGKEQALVGKKSHILNKYAALLKEIEGQEFSSPLLKAEQERLAASGKLASEAIADLGNLTYMLDQRLNAFAGILLNGTVLWDIKYMMRLERWREKHKEELPRWFEVIGKWDALLSWSRFQYNYPDFVVPEISEGDFMMDAKELGHPLLDPATRIDNDMNLAKPGEFLIITGANMAGKSTFLRTVGVNLILAMNGAVTCAKSFKFAPIEMLTSVRATDSLQDHESYFYAELKRLKMLIDKLKEGKPIFIIVDEMLRGTNSRDKQEGSRQFIMQLMELKGVGMIATHDLSLGTLQEEFPDYARNKRFEVDITDGHLSFDYKLRDGISQNLNATFLMKKMGIMP